MKHYVIVTLAFLAALLSSTAAAQNTTTPFVNRINVGLSTFRLTQGQASASDLNPKYKLLLDGTQSWGPGGASATDVTLTRSGTGILGLTVGTLNLANPLPVGSGGLGIATYAIGDLVYASASTTLSKLADVATGAYLASGGVTTAPAWATLNQAAVAGLRTSDSPTFTGLTATAAATLGNQNGGEGTYQELYSGARIGSTKASGALAYALMAGSSGSDYGSIGYGWRPTVTAGSYKYDVSDVISMLTFGNAALNDGGFSFFVANSGTAGNVATRTNALSYDRSTQVWNFPLATASTSSTTGAVKLAGGLGVAGAINVGNTVTVSPANTVANALTLNGGKTALDNDFVSIVPSSTSATTGTSAFKIDTSNIASGAAFALWVKTAATAADAIKVSTQTSDVVLGSTTASTSSTTGALKTAGGLGVAGDLFTGGGVTPGSYSGSTAGNVSPARNYVINSNYSFSQRKGSGSYSTSAAYSLDHWYFKYDSTSASVAQVSTALTSNDQRNVNSQSQNMVAITQTTIGTGTFLVLLQPIESNIATQLTGKYVTLSAAFRKNGSCGTNNIVMDVLTTGTPNDTPANLLAGTVAASSTFSTSTLNNTTLLVRPPPATGQIGYSAYTIGVYFNLGAVPSSCVISIADVMLNEGTQAAPYNMAAGNGNFAGELALVERYFEKSYDVGTASPTNATLPGQRSMALGTNTIIASQDYGSVVFHTRKYKDPTVNVYSYTSSTVGAVSNCGAGTDLAASSGLTEHVGTGSFSVFDSAGILTTTSGAVCFHWDAEAEL